VDDVSVAVEAKKMIAAAVKRFGRIDVLIANADVIDSAKEEQGRLLRRLYEWAVSLDHEGLVRLGTYHA
jgi:NAD(P)-dependent dehydrogenase (short-subunit alcohol dehydrogenase family)